MPVKITADIVKAEVERFWQVFTGKFAEELAEFYAHESSVFGSQGKRTEPGRLAAARRQREYFHPQSVLRAELGEIEILLIGDSAAVATYIFKFHAAKITNVLGKSMDEEIQNGRATQVFAPDAGGKLRIIHEHLSLPAA